MSESRIAIRYSRPILDIALEQNVLEKVKKDMENILEICNKSREFLLLLKSPIIPHLKKAEILSQIFKNKVENLTLSALEIISRKNREAYLPDIASSFLKIYDERKGVQKAVVTTTFTLDSNIRKTITDTVKEITSKEADLEERKDPKILGGFVLKMGDLQLDQSIATKIKKLRLQLNK